MGKATGWNVALGVLVAIMCLVVWAKISVGIPLIRRSGGAHMPSPPAPQSVMWAVEAKELWEQRIAYAQRFVDLDVVGGAKWREAQAIAAEAAQIMKTCKPFEAARAYDEARKALEESWSPNYEARRRTAGDDARDAWLAALAKAPAEDALDKLGGASWYRAKMPVAHVEKQYASAATSVSWNKHVYLGATRDLARAVKAIDETAMLLEGHEAGIAAIAFSPDGKMLTSVGPGGVVVKLWNTTTGDCVQMLKGCKTRVSVAAVDAASKTIASTEKDATIRLWDLATGQCVQTFKGHETVARVFTPVVSVVFSRDGKLLVSGGADRTVRLWDRANGNCIQTLWGHMDLVRTVAISPDGRTIASGDDAGMVKLWDRTTGDCLRTLERADSMVSSVAFSPDGKTLADSAIRLSNVATGERLCMPYYERQGRASVIVFSPNGKVLAAVSRRGVVGLWDVATGEHFQSFEGHKQDRISIAFSPDGKTIASVGRGRQWDTRIPAESIIRLWRVKVYAPGRVEDPTPDGKPAP